MSDMFYNGEVEVELRDNLYTERRQWVFHVNEDREKHIKAIIAQHSSSIYEHTPSPKCAERG